MRSKWPGVEFSEVRAYAWPVDEDRAEVISFDMTISSGVLNRDGALLSDRQVARLLNAVIATHKDYPVYLCYYPHNAFVFYDAEQKPVAFVELCFDCSGSRIYPEGASEKIDFLVMADLFGELHLPMGEYSDAEKFKAQFEITRKSLEDEQFV